MEIALLLARLALAGVFLVAGIAKLADRNGSSNAIAGFGVPQRLAGPLGTMLPIAEIAVATLLLPASTARWGAIGALALLLAFITGIAWNLARGRQPDCHCFGQLHSEPAGWPTLVRNGILSALATFLLVRGWNDAGAGVLGWASDLGAFERSVVAVIAALAAVVAIEGWGLLQLMRQNGRLMLRLDEIQSDTTPQSQPKTNTELPVGSPAPPFALPGIDGGIVTLADLVTLGRKVVLVFVNPTCHACAEILPDIGRWQREHVSTMTIVVISRGDVEANRAKLEPHGITHVLVEETSDVAKAYGLNGRPTAVVVRPDLTIGSPLGEKADGIRRLVQRTIDESATPVVATTSRDDRAGQPAVPGLAG